MPYCSAMTSGRLRITPPAPSRIVLVCAATWAISTEVAEDAIDAMLWCSAYQTRLYPASSAFRARATVPSSASAGVWSRAAVARSRIDSGTGMGAPFVE